MAGGDLENSERQHARSAPPHGQQARTGAIDGEIFVYQELRGSERDRLSVERGGELNCVSGGGGGNCRSQRARAAIGGIDDDKRARVSAWTRWRRKRMRER